MVILAGLGFPRGRAGVPFSVVSMHCKKPRSVYYGRVGLLRPSWASVSVFITNLWRSSSPNCRFRVRIDEEWAVTTQGVELLKKEYEESANFVPGWVFRDPWNGNLWPFVAPSLEYARTAQDEKGYPVLELGTTGKPWQQSGMDAEASPT